MASFDQIRSRIADQFKERGVDRLVYFHCDHFEPWSHVNNRQAADPGNVADVVAFAEQCKRIDFARKLTLFYKPHSNFAWDSRSDLVRATPDDPVGFVSTKPNEEQAFKQAMKYLVDTVDHEIQVHIHHEGYTANSGHAAAERKAYSQSADAARRDSERLRLAIRLAKNAVHQEMNIDLKNWLFVHGLWALQGSDETVCRIANELEILASEGCIGDFTFPAGRAHVNPRIEVPYLCQPISKIRGYDHTDANPEPAFENSASANGKFFVWASRIKADWSSLDYYNADVRRRLERPEEWATQVIRDSYYVQGTLFFKTHAHSMQPEYREAARLSIPPHAHPAIQSLMSLIFDAAALADVEVKFATASEVYELLVHNGAVWQQQQSTSPDGQQESPTAQAVVAGPSASPANNAPSLEVGVPLAEPAWQSSLRELLTEKRARQVLSKDESGAEERTHETAFLRVGLPTSPSDLVRTANSLNEIACQSLAARIAELGVNGSGAHDYYAKQVKAGTLVRDIDVAIADVLGMLPGFRHFHEVRAGLGMLAMLIGASGRSAVAIEPDALRYAASASIFESAVHGLPELSACCSLVHGRFPQAVAECDTRKSLAIFTDHIATIVEADILAGIRLYAGALIDIDRFGRQLTSDAERRELLSRFKAFGFKSIRPILDLANQGRYFLISEKPIDL